MLFIFVWNASIHHVAAFIDISCAHLFPNAIDASSMVLYILLYKNINKYKIYISIYYTRAPGPIRSPQPKPKRKPIPKPIPTPSGTYIIIPIKIIIHILCINK